MVGTMCLLEGFPRVVKTENVEGDWEDARRGRVEKWTNRDGDDLHAWMPPPETSGSGNCARPFGTFVQPLPSCQRSE